MSEKPKWWRGVKTDAEEHPSDNVVHMPRPTLDDLETQLIDAQNAVISAEVECERAARIYADRLEQLKASRLRISERMKECGARVEFPQSFPEPS